MEHEAIDLPDAELARRIASRPGAARQEESALCARFERRVRLYGLRHLRDPEAASDLAQRVLVVMLEKLRSGAVRDPGRIASFALGVARRVALEMGRGARRESPLPEAVAEVLAAPSGRAEPGVPERLAECLGALRERERAVVLMTFYEERSAAEIAAAVATSEDNVRLVRHRAIVRLRCCMGLGKEEEPP